MTLLSITDSLAALEKLGRPMNDRRLRKLCAAGRVEGAVKIGKTWVIPEDSLVSVAQDIRESGRPAKKKA